MSFKAALFGALSISLTLSSFAHAQTSANAQTPAPTILCYSGSGSAFSGTLERNLPGIDDIKAISMNIGATGEVKAMTNAQGWLMSSSPFRVTIKDGNDEIVNITGPDNNSLTYTDASGTSTGGCQIMNDFPPTAVGPAPF